MFDSQPASPAPAGKPVEDIFAGTEQGGTPLSVDPPTGKPSGAFPEAASGNSHQWVAIAGALVAVLLVGGLGYWWWSGRTPAAPPAPVVTTPEVPNPTPVVQPVAEQPTPEQLPTAPVVQPPAPDQDGDGLPDEEERALGTDPTKADSDGDGLFDREEVKIYRSNPLDPDSDHDGFTDGQEVQNGYNPTGPGKLLELPQPPAS